MNKRTLFGFLLVAVLAATSGCSAEGSLRMEPVDDAGLAEAASDPAGNGSDADSALVRAAIENGSATTVADHPPVEQRLPFRHDGRFYNVSYTEAGTEPGYGVDISIDYNASSVEGEVIDYERLPAVDREALSRLLERSEFPEEQLQTGYDFGTRQIYTEAEANDSVLVATQEYEAVRYDGDVYPIWADSEPRTLTTYRYESALVAEGAAAYASQLRNRYEFDLSGLSDAEREIVEGSMNDTYYIEDSDNDGFASLVDRFRSHESVHEDYYGYYVVSYEGQLYWAEMDYGSYATDTGPAVTQPSVTPPTE